MECFIAVEADIGIVALETVIQSISALFATKININPLARNGALTQSPSSNQIRLTLSTNSSTVTKLTAIGTLQTNPSIIIITSSADTSSTIISEMVSDIAHADICLIFYVMLLDAAGCACQGVVA